MGYIDCDEKSIRALKEYTKEKVLKEYTKEKEKRNKRKVIIGYAIILYGAIGVLLHNYLIGGIVIATWCMPFLAWCMWYNENPLKDMVVWFKRRKC